MFREEGTSLAPEQTGTAVGPRRPVSERVGVLQSCHLGLYLK